MNNRSIAFEMQWIFVASLCHRVLSNHPNIDKETLDETIFNMRLRYEKCSSEFLREPAPVYLAEVYLAAIGNRDCPLEDMWDLQGILGYSCMKWEQFYLQHNDLYTKAAEKVLQAITEWEQNRKRF